MFEKLSISLLEANIILNFLKQDISFYDKDLLSFSYTKVRSIECYKWVFQDYRTRCSKFSFSIVKILRVEKMRSINQ